MSNVIRILGVSESARMRLLKANVEAALQHMGLNVPIEEVTEIDQLMEYGVLGIPALVLGRQILFQREIPEVKYIVDVLLKEMRAMGKPTASSSRRMPPDQLNKIFE